MFNIRDENAQNMKEQFLSKNQFTKFNEKTRKKSQFKGFLYHLCQKTLI